MNKILSENDIINKIIEDGQWKSETDIKKQIPLIIKEYKTIVKGQNKYIATISYEKYPYPNSKCDYFSEDDSMNY